MIRVLAFLLLLAGRAAAQPAQPPPDAPPPDCGCGPAGKPGGPR